MTHKHHIIKHLSSFYLLLIYLKSNMAYTLKGGEQMILL